MNRTMVLLLVLAVAAVAGCGSDSESVVDPPVVVIAEELVGPTWHQVAWFDSYDDVWHEMTRGAADKVFTFDEDGTFVTDWVGGCCRRTGTWSYLDDSQKLALSYDGDLGDVEYDVLVLHGQEMQLAWPGQHGTVINKYARRP